MAIWEYKVISSGKGGFATPAMLEKFLNDLGKEEWEIIEYKTPEDNPLAFSGLARRPTQRDWTLEDAAATAAKQEADKLREEFEAKFKGLAPTGGAEEEEDSALAGKVAPEDGYRSPVDTSRDQDPDADDEEDGPKDEWEELMDDDDLPTFFEAIRPHMRRNQRGAGVSVGVSYLAKKWNFDDEDITGALEECGFEMPEDEKTKPAYLEYDGDLYWLNINRRGELWINTKEKPMPVFRTVKGEAVEVEDEPNEKKKAAGKTKKDDQAAPEKEAESPKEQKSDQRDSEKSKPLPKGEELLALIRPKMRRSRREPGHSGSVSFLSRALKCSTEDLQAAFEELGLALSENKDEKPEPTQIGDELWWLNQDSRGGVWINGRRKKENKDEQKATQDSLLKKVRPHLTKKRKETFSQEIGVIAEQLSQSVEELQGELSKLGLQVPEKPRQKPVTVEESGEVYWLSINTKKEVLLNTKAVEKATESEPEESVENQTPPPEVEASKAEQPKPKRSNRSRPRKKPAAKKAE